MKAYEGLRSLGKELVRDRAADGLDEQNEDCQRDRHRRRLLRAGNAQIEGQRGGELRLKGFAED